MDVRFGNLTTQSGQKVKFEDFDKDGDGKITEQEYNAALQEFGLDSVELSNVDKNNDKTVTNDEFQLWEQKIKMEELLQPYLKKVTTDFTGANSSYASQMTTALRELIDKYAEEHISNGQDVSTLAEKFESDIAKRYETLKNEILSKSPTVIKSKVVDSLLEEEIAKSRTTVGGGLDSDEVAIFTKNLGSALEAEANKFIKEYKGDNLEKDLKAHLEVFLVETDAAVMNEAVTKYKSSLNGFGAYIDEAELDQIKSSAIEMMSKAISEGLTVTLGGFNYTSVSALETKVKSYKDADTLKSDVQTFIDSLNKKNVVEIARDAAISKAEENEYNEFIAIKGSEYQVDASEIDYSKIDGYYENKEYKVKGKKSQGTLRERLEMQLRETIETTIKKQMRAQINAMLMEKGISTDKIDQIFENVFNQSMTQTFEMEGIIKTQNKTWFRRGHARCDIKTVVDTFIQTFNTNMSKTMDEMNASKTDMDTQDLDYTQAGRRANGSPIIDPDTGVNLTEAYADDKVLTVKGKGSDYYKSLAEQMIEGMRAQMLRKAETMCKANGVEFDAAIFNTKFNNAKMTAVNAAVTGKGGKASATWAEGAGAAAGAGAGVGTAAVIGGLTTTTTVVTETGFSILTVPTKLALMSGPIGWVVGGVLVAGAVALMLLGGNKSSCSLDTGTLLDTFTDTFKEDYSAWVEKEKAEKK